MLNTANQLSEFNSVLLLLLLFYTVSQKKSMPKCFCRIFYKTWPMLIKYRIHSALNKFATKSVVNIFTS